MPPVTQENVDAVQFTINKISALSGTVKDLQVLLGSVMRRIDLLDPLAHHVNWDDIVADYMPLYTAKKEAIATALEEMP